MLELFPFPIFKMIDEIFFFYCQIILNFYYNKLWLFQIRMQLMTANEVCIHFLLSQPYKLENFWQIETNYTHLLRLKLAHCVLRTFWMRCWIEVQIRTVELSTVSILERNSISCKNIWLKEVNPKFSWFTKNDEIILHSKNEIKKKSNLDNTGFQLCFNLLFAQFVW